MSNPLARTSMTRAPRPRFTNALRFATTSAAALLLFAAPALAQFRASIQGTVTDSTGGVIPNAALTLVDNATNRTLTATANESGVYSFNALPPDTFTLTATAQGFQKNVIQNLHVTPEQANTVDVQLTLGDVATTVNVNADTLPALETATASLSGTVTSRDIQNLPSAGRDVFQLAQLAPGAFGDGAQGAGGGTNSLPGTQGPGGTTSGQGIYATENGPQALSGGGQYETNGISIDGISTVSAVWGGTSIITPNEDSVDSVKISTNAYDSENGRFSGANLQVTTKAGTNNFHGSAYIRVFRPGLNAYQRYNGPGSLSAFDSNNVKKTPSARGLLRDTSRLNDIGGSIGGPIWKDHLFAFFAYDTIRNNTNTTVNGWYETPEFDASAPAGNISNILTTFPGNTPVNGTQIDQTCTTLGLTEGVNCRTIAGKGLDVGSPLRLARGQQDPTYVSSSNPGVGNGLDGVADLVNLQTATPTAVVQTQYNGRLDADATKRDHLSFAIYWQPVSIQNINGAARSYNQWNHNQTNDAFSGIWNHTFGPTWLNEARTNAAGWRWNEITDNPQAPFGLPLASSVTYGNADKIQPFGASGPSHFNQWTYGFKDVATKIWGNHTIKFGGDATKLQYLQDNVAAARPGFNFYNLWNFLNDAPYQETGTFDRFTGIPFSNRFDQRQWILGAFVQDDWKATPNLTINYGLRYNYFDGLYSKQDNLPHVVFGQGSALFTGITLKRGGNAWQPDNANFGPQFGFAYNPDFLNHKFVIRGGYGINYNQEEIAISANTSFNPNDAVTPSFNQSTPQSADPRIVYAIPSDPKSLFGYPPNPNTITAYGANGLPVNSGFSLTTYPNHLRTQQVHHYSLDTQFDLGRQMVATVGYQGSTAHHLIYHQNGYIWGAYNNIAFNPSISSLENFGDYGASNYNALLVGFKHPFSHQFSVNADFTYSKSMDDNSGPYQEDFYPYNAYFNRARSDFNFGKAFKVYGTYSPVIYTGGHRIIRTLVNGFNFSGIYNLHSGFPWTPISNSGTDVYYAGSGYGNLRPASYNGQAGHDLSNSAFTSASGPSKNFQGTDPAHPALSYFAVPTYTTASFPGPVTSFPTPGIARNSFDGPKYEDVDATVVKSFGLGRIPGLGESSAIEFRADAFNLFNQTNLNIARIDANINDASFGIIQAALGSRTVQLQARFSF